MQHRNELKIPIINHGTIYLSLTSFSDSDARGVELIADNDTAARPAEPAQPAAPLNVPRFLHERASPIVVDRDRNLMWSRAPLGAARKTFAEAEAAVAGCRLGDHSDWRLPTREELQSLVDYTTFNPAIDTEAFPDTPPNYFWSSSPDASAPGYAWVVGFHRGYVGLYRRKYGAFVRAVRSVPASQ